MQKKTIPWTVENSFFYIKNASKPIRFTPIAPEKVNPQPKGGTTPEYLETIYKKHAQFMKKLKESINNLDNREALEKIAKERDKENQKYNYENFRTLLESQETNKNVEENGVKVKIHKIKK